LESKVFSVNATVKAEEKGAYGIIRNWFGLVLLHNPPIILIGTKRKRDKEEAN